MAPDSEPASCGSCRFMDFIVMYQIDVTEDGHEDQGMQPDSICRRFPPADGTWSAVMADDWCGEWSATDDIAQRAP